MSEYKINPTDSDCGCWFDGDVRGRFVGEAVIEQASEYGFANNEHTKADDEFHWDAVQEAEDYLNSITDPEYSFSFHDGSFFLLSVKDWQELDCA